MFRFSSELLSLVLGCILEIRAIQSGWPLFAFSFQSIPSVTDWRLALAGVVIALTVAGTVVPQFGFGMWAQNPGELVINWPNGLVLFFAIGGMLISRIVDENWRIVRMKAQLKALGVVAHELRTPLAGLQLLGSALSEQIEEVASSKSVTPQDWGRMKMLAREGGQADRWCARHDLNTTGELKSVPTILGSSTDSHQARG